MEKQKLLIIDDNPAILKSHSMLFGNNFDVDTSESVDDGIHKLMNYEYPVALIDMEIHEEPDGGLRVCEAIRDKGLMTKAVIFTAYGNLSNAKKGFKACVFRYLEKKDSLTEIQDTVLEAAEKFLREKVSKESIFPYSMAAHTFEKCYNTPVRNMCYILRQFIHPHNDRARMITFAIQDYIDLWANHFSASTYDGQETHRKRWIECFPLSEFKDDLNNFARHIFNLRINNLYDDCYEKYMPDTKRISESDLYDKTRCFQNVWNGEEGMAADDFFQLDIELKEGIYIFGIRPFFRVIMINMLENAIEDIDLYKIRDRESNHAKPQISISVFQDLKTTSISFKNEGRGMEESMLKRLNENIFQKAQHNELTLRDSDWAEDLRYRRNTSKSGTGTGRALAEAAHYFSRIVRISEDGSEVEKNGGMKVEASKADNYATTEFTIHLPFGKKIIDEYKKRNDNSRKPPEKVAYLWEI